MLNQNRSFFENQTEVETTIEAAARRAGVNKTDYLLGLVASDLNLHPAEAGKRLGVIPRFTPKPTG